VVVDTRQVEHVVDQDGVRLELGRRLGKGGQGVVLRVVDPPGLAVKRLNAPGRRVREQLEGVRRLPLADLPIVPPTAMLQGGAGYVMQLAEDMVPWAYLAPVEFGARHDAPWYVATGGLRRRLRLGARLAGGLASLHGLGLVYVDLNPGNVMVSERPEDEEVVLIDADNIGSVYRDDVDFATPGFAAPERWKGYPPTPRSDDQSLAIMLFALLTMVHPFFGQMTRELDAEEFNERRDRGRSLSSTIRATRGTAPSEGSGVATPSAQPCEGCLSARSYAVWRNHGHARPRHGGAMRPFRQHDTWSTVRGPDVDGRTTRTSPSVHGVATRVRNSHGSRS
jgi:DNA-binding helix-hairpin-helix protein with protein kinase domain